MQQPVRKKRKKSMEEKIKSNQMKILHTTPSDGQRNHRFNSRSLNSSQLPQQFWSAVASLSSGRNHKQQPASPSSASLGVMKSCDTFERPAGGGTGRQAPFKLAVVMKLTMLALIVGLANRPAEKLQGAASTISDFDGATFYKAPVGSRIRIACNASHWNDDSISLVLWFKGNPTGPAAQPIYTIDARQKPLSSGQARHLVADSFKGRARFVFPQQQQLLQQTQTRTGATQAAGQLGANSTLAPFLDLSPIEADDQGEYRCRVDYRSRPRENFLIILFVLVPPSSVEITDPNGRALEQIYGPLNEGSELKLVCLSKGGRPPPAIVWKRAGHVIDDSYLTLNDFLTLKLANETGHGLAASPGWSPNSSAGLKQQLDNNLAQASSLVAPGDNQTARRTQQQPKQEVSSDSGGGGKLAAVADWLAWPEFNYFHSDGQLMSASRPQPPFIGQSAAAGHLRQSGSFDQQQPAEKQHPQPQSQPQLIDWQVDTTTTTGVNVLHLSELTRAHLLDDWAPEETGPQLTTSTTTTTTTTMGTVANRRPGPQGAVVSGPILSGGARLECHASNAHYDLHSLIKLFAPPSLQESAGDSGDTNDMNNVSTTTTVTAGFQRLGPGRNSMATRAAFAQAIERAIWANLKSASTQADSNEVHESQAPSSARVVVAHLHRNHHRHQQQHSEDAPSSSSVISTATTNQQQQHNTAQDEPNWSRVIQQQLIRPHQLVAAALSSASNPGSPLVGPIGSELPPTPSLGEQASAKPAAAAATSPSHLSRSKIIALEANLLPLNVRITSPGRALAAGQVHEFTCQSEGSRPPARLTWLKDGRRLNPKLAHQAQYGTEQQYQTTLAARANVPGSKGDLVTTLASSAEAYKLSGAALAASTSSSLISQSKLTIKLEREDHNARLSCRAENEQYKRTKTFSSRPNTTRPLASDPSSATAAEPNHQASQQNLGPEEADSSGQERTDDQNWQLEDTVTLNVHYVPRVRLELGNKMLSERIREGQDIYFVCRLDSNPAVNEITWLHNDRPINESQPIISELMVLMDAQGPGSGEESSKKHRLPRPGDPAMGATSAGNSNGAQRPAPPQANLIVSNDSLVLQRVQIEQSGQYNCLASNSEGVGLSNQIELRVLHAPICVATKTGSLSSSSPATTTTLAYQSGSTPRHQIIRDASGQPALSLGSFRLPMKTGEPLRLACQMLVPDEDDRQQQQLEQLEFTWYLNNSFNERRLLARQTSRDADLKLIDAHQSDLLGLPWRHSSRQQQDGVVVRQLGANAGPVSGMRGGGPKPLASKNTDADTTSQQRMKTSRGVRLAVAYLNLNWDQTSGLEPQIGQLFCMARNSIGEQRRACRYQIEAPMQLAEPRGRTSSSDNPDELASTSPAPFSCLSVNVTTNSAWIGCDFSGRRGHQHLEPADSNRPEQQHQLEITQVDENNDRLRQPTATLATSRSGGGGSSDDDDDEGEQPRFRFNVLVFCLPDLALDQVSETRANGEPGEPFNRQLEANLSSGPLDEPLFAVANLRPNTKYMLEIEELSQAADQQQQQQQTASVSLRTLAKTTETSAGGRSGTGSLAADRSTTETVATGSRALTSRPSIRQVTEPHRPDLLAAALISTRSSQVGANQQSPLYHHTSSAGGIHSQQHQSNHRLLEQRQANERPRSMWSSVTGALAQLVGIQESTGGEQRQAQTRAKRPNQASSLAANSRASGGDNSATTSSYLTKLTSLDSDSLFALCLCVLVLLLVTLISLIAMHRARLCGGRRESRHRSRATFYEATKLSSLSGSGSRMMRPGSDGTQDAREEEGDDDDERAGTGSCDADDEQKKPPRSPQSSSVSNSATPPTKQERLESMGVSTPAPPRRGSMTSTGLKFQNHHYSTLNSRLAQHPAVPSMGHQQQPPMINFLKSSSISSASSTMQRNDWRIAANINRFAYHHHQHQHDQDHHQHHHSGARGSPVMILQATGHDEQAAGQQHQSQPGMESTVTRSRSLLGFGFGSGGQSGSMSCINGESAALVLMAQMQATGPSAATTTSRAAGGQPVLGATAAAATTRQRLMQSNGDGTAPTSPEQTSLLADELRLQSGKWLISDANFSLPSTATIATAIETATTTTTATSSETEGDPHQHQHKQQQQPHRESWPYIEIKAPNRIKLNSSSNNNEDLRRDSASPYTFGLARLSKLSPVINECCNNDTHQHQCNCNELSLGLATNCDLKTAVSGLDEPALGDHNHHMAHNFTGPFLGDALCCSVVSHHQHHHNSNNNNQQQCSGFIELLPNSGSDHDFHDQQQSAILAYGHRNQQACYELSDGRESIEVQANTADNLMRLNHPSAGVQHRAQHDKHYHHHHQHHPHHVIFNQSLNSSSVGSPSTNNQYGSSPLGSLTNTNSSNTESYQNQQQHNDNNENNNMILVTSSDEQHDGDMLGGCRPASKRDGRLSELASNATNTSNYSSDGFSPVASNPARTTNQRPATTKPRLQPILKNCTHSINDTPPLPTALAAATTTTTNRRPTTNDQSGVVRDNED